MNHALGASFPSQIEAFEILDRWESCNVSLSGDRYTAD